MKRTGIALRASAVAAMVGVFVAAEGGCSEDPVFLPVPRGSTAPAASDGGDRRVTDVADAGPILEGLAGYWPLDGDGADKSGHGRSFAIRGGAAFSGGLVGQALTLNGDPAQYAVMAASDSAFSFDASDFTIQVWIRFRSTTSEQTILEKFTGQAGPGWTITKLASGALQFYGQPGISYDAARAPLSTGVWHQIVVRRTGSTFVTYVDAQPVATASSASAIPASTSPLLLGRRNEQDGRAFPVDGSLDEVAIWNRALSDLEIARNYGSGAPAALLP